MRVFHAGTSRSRNDSRRPTVCFRCGSVVSAPQSSCAGIRRRSEALCFRESRSYRIGYMIFSSLKLKPAQPCTRPNAYRRRSLLALGRDAAVPASDGLLASGVLDWVRRPHGGRAVGDCAFAFASHRPAYCPLVFCAPSGAHCTLAAERAAQQFARAETQVDVRLRDYQIRNGAYPATTANAYAGHAGG